MIMMITMKEGCYEFSSAIGICISLFTSEHNGLLLLLCVFTHTHSSSSRSGW
jgi:hypothetical protein